MGSVRWATALGGQPVAERCRGTVMMAGVRVGPVALAEPSPACAVPIRAKLSLLLALPPPIVRKPIRGV